MTRNTSQSKQLDGRDAKTGRFLAGNSGNGGRKVGSRNKLTTEFLNDVYAKWQTDGKAVLDAVCRDKPHEFLKLVGHLMPKEIDAALSMDVSVVHEVADFVAAYRHALKVIGSDRAKLIEGGNGRRSN